jgi:hypothetical protein
MTEALKTKESQYAELFETRDKHGISRFGLTFVLHINPADRGNTWCRRFSIR